MTVRGCPIGGYELLPEEFTKRVLANTEFTPQVMAEVRKLQSKHAKGEGTNWNKGQREAQSEIFREEQRSIPFHTMSEEMQDHLLKNPSKQLTGDKPIGRDEIARLEKFFAKDKTKTSLRETEIKNLEKQAKDEGKIYVKLANNRKLSKDAKDALAKLEEQRAKLRIKRETAQTPKSELTDEWDTFHINKNSKAYKYDPVERAINKESVPVGLPKKQWDEISVEVNSLNRQIGSLNKQIDKYTDINLSKMLMNKELSKPNWKNIQWVRDRAFIIRGIVRGKSLPAEQKVLREDVIDEYLKNSLNHEGQMWQRIAPEDITPGSVEDALRARERLNVGELLGLYQVWELKELRAQVRKAFKVAGEETDAPMFTDRTVKKQPHENALAAALGKAGYEFDPSFNR